MRESFHKSYTSGLITLVAKVVPPEAVIEALGSVRYPGFPTDILSLGIVEDVAPKPGGQGFTITIRQATENEAIVQKLAAGIHQALGHGLGLDDVELRVRRIEAELGAKTGRMRLP